MSVSIVLVTTDKKIHRHVEDKKEALVPGELRKLSDGSVVTVTSHYVDGEGGGVELKKRLLSIAQHKRGIIVLASQKILDAISDISEVVFFNKFDEERARSAIHNSISRIFGRAVKDFESIRKKMADEKSAKCLLLPISNFVSEELKAMVQLCTSSFSFEKFAHELEEALKLLRSKRQRPKRASDSPRTYLVDDRDRHFEYGKERHARCETAPPHDYMCLFRRDFRFGVRFDAERHFNVSLDKGSIKSHVFGNCHGDEGRCDRDSHVNMFPGGYFT